MRHDLDREIAAVHHRSGETKVVAIEWKKNVGRNQGGTFHNALPKQKDHTTKKKLGRYHRFKASAKEGGRKFRKKRQQTRARYPAAREKGFTGDYKKTNGEPERVYEHSEGKRRLGKANERGGKV